MKAISEDGEYKPLLLLRREGVVASSITSRLEKRSHQLPVDHVTEGLRGRRSLVLTFTIVAVAFVVAVFLIIIIIINRRSDEFSFFCFIHRRISLVRIRHIV